MMDTTCQIERNEITWSLAAFYVATSHLHKFWSIQGLKEQFCLMTAFMAQYTGWDLKKASKQNFLNESFDQRPSRVFSCSESKSEQKCRSTFSNFFRIRILYAIPNFWPKKCQNWPFWQDFCFLWIKKVHKWPGTGICMALGVLVLLQMTSSTQKQLLNNDL